MRNQNRMRLVACLGALLLTLSLLSAGGNHPFFVLSPDPPSAGADIEVTYGGNRDSRVVVQIGDGEEFTPKIGKGKKFKIPKAKLKPGQFLYIADTSSDLPEAAVCVEIEP